MLTDFPVDLQKKIILIERLKGNRNFSNLSLLRLRGGFCNEVPVVFTLHHF